MIDGHPAPALRLDDAIDTLLATDIGRAQLAGVLKHLTMTAPSDTPMSVLTHTLMVTTGQAPAPVLTPLPVPMCIGCGLGGDGVRLDDNDLCAVCRLTCAVCGVKGATLPEHLETDVETIAAHGACTACLDAVSESLRY